MVVSDRASTRAPARNGGVSFLIEATVFDLVSQSCPCMLIKVTLSVVCTAMNSVRTALPLAKSW